MALSASVLALGRPIGASHDFPDNVDGIDFSFSVKRESGEVQKYTIESNERLRQYNTDAIPPNHRIAICLSGKSTGDVLAWPNSAGDESVLIVERKHKILDAFHEVIRRFEDKFPHASGFMSVQVNTDKSDGLDELRSILKRRAEYSQSKAREYEDGNLPIAIVAFQLGIDPIDALLGLYAECNVSLKTASATAEDQMVAAAALQMGLKRGLLLDAAACHIVRRMGIEDTIEAVFGKIAITQNTLDIYLARLQQSEQSVLQCDANEGRGAGSISFRDGRMVFSETPEADVVARHELIKKDVHWISTREIVAAASRVDPPESVARFRSMKGGAFLDDLLAANGCGRVLISEDFFFRKMGRDLFDISSSWIQSLLMFLASREYLSYEEVVKGTLNLLALGQVALSVNYSMIIAASKMLVEQGLDQTEYDRFVSIIGQPGADYGSHADVVATSLRILHWKSNLSSVRNAASNALLTSLISNAGKESSSVLDFLEGRLRGSPAEVYVRNWRFGHFL